VAISAQLSATPAGGLAAGAVLLGAGLSGVEAGVAGGVVVAGAEDALDGAGVAAASLAA
jgi:hypothetical protein